MKRILKTIRLSPWCVHKKSRVMKTGICAVINILLIFIDHVYETKEF